MPGYGSLECRNDKKGTIDWPIIAFVSQKNYMRIYVCAVKNGE